MKLDSKTVVEKRKPLLKNAKNPKAEAFGLL
jgi:hypothetical protein